MALTKITKSGLTGDVVDETKIADNAISEEHLDVTSLTGHTELAATAADDDILLIYDTSAGTLKKIQKSNVALQSPTFSSVSPTSLVTGDLTGNYTIVVTGTKFDESATFSLIATSGSEITMDTVVRNSSTQLTGTVAKNTANLTNANEPFDIKITNGNGLAITSQNQINIDAQPVFTTTAGTLGTVNANSAISTIDIVAADPESAGNVTFDVQSGTIPPGLSTATVNENGVSKFRITGTPDNPSATTTFNFTLRASDAASNTSSRAFSITVTRIPVSQSFTASGTFSVPSGMTSLNAVLVVGGGGSGGAQHAGGGGAGGLIFMPEYPVTPGGTVTVTVGCGGAFAPESGPDLLGQDSVFGSPGDPGLGSGGVLTAKGGGGGAMAPAGPLIQQAQSGGSGGGGGYASPQGNAGGSATQPTQPGNSGAYGFGNAGGNSTGSGAQNAGAGGGGAGGAGGNAPDNNGANGGVGKAYTIADGTTPVYYAGGGGGASHQPGGSPTRGLGGQGGGGDGGYGTPSGNPPGTAGQCGAANKGGGGGGAFYQKAQGCYGGVGACQSKGGKGIVIVRY